MMQHTAIKTVLKQYFLRLLCWVRGHQREQYHIPVKRFDPNVTFLCGKHAKDATLERMNFTERENSLEQLLKMRQAHDKEHRQQYDVPPAFCPLCTDKLADTREQRHI